MAEDDARVVVLGKKRRLVERAVGEPFRRESNVLEDERRSRWTRATDRRQQSAAHVPELRGKNRVLREFRGLEQFEPGQRRIRSGLDLVTGGLAWRAEHDK